jgi:hypothetical protein
MNAMRKTPQAATSRTVGSGTGYAAKRLLGDGQRLDIDGHAVPGRMDQAGFVQHQAHMALPEHQVAPPQPGEVRLHFDGGPELLLLHVAVTGRLDAGGGERRLSEARAVEADAGLSAPEIGRMEQAFGHGDIVGFETVELRQMRGEDPASTGELGIAPLDPCHGQFRVDGQEAGIRQLQVRAGIDESAHGADPVSGCRSGLTQGDARQVAHIAVVVELHPGPTLVLVVDGHGLAQDGLGIDWRLARRVAVEGRIGLDHAFHGAGCEPLRFDLPAQLLVGQISAGRSDAAVEGHRGSSLARAVMMSPSRSTASAPATVR